MTNNYLGVISDKALGRKGDILLTVGRGSGVVGLRGLLCIILLGLSLVLGRSGVVGPGLVHIRGITGDIGPGGGEDGDPGRGTSSSNILLGGDSIPGDGIINGDAQGGRGQGGGVSLIGEIVGDHTCRRNIQR